MIDIVDNYLPEKDFFELFNSMKEFSFDWHLSHILTKDAEKNPIGNMQFCHLFYRMHEQNTRTIPLLIPILTKINTFALISCRVNRIFDKKGILLII